MSKRCCKDKKECLCNDNHPKPVVTLDSLSQAGVFQSTPFNVNYTLLKSKCQVTIQFPAFSFTLNQQGTLVTADNSIPFKLSPSSVTPLSFPVNLINSPVGSQNAVLQIDNVGNITIRGVNNSFLPAGSYTVSPAVITYVLTKRTLDEKITIADLERESAIFQSIAATDPVNGFASAGPAYNKAVAYLQQELDKVGYNVTLQTYENSSTIYDAPPALSVLEPTPREFFRYTDFAIFTYSIGTSQPTPPEGLDLELFVPANQGCQISDYAGAAGKIVLTTTGRSGCPAGTLQTAQNAGAKAIIFNRADDPTLTGPIPLFAGGLSTSTIPVLLVTGKVRDELVALSQTVPKVVMNIKCRPITIPRIQTNVIAESRTGDPNNEIVLGAHLDTVFNAGVNDDNSGVVTLLTLARLLKCKKLNNKITFAFWANEEAGLYGSEYYVNQRVAAGTLDRIKLNINIDMIASANYVRVFFLPAPAYGQEAYNKALILFQPFVEYFQSQGITYQVFRSQVGSDNVYFGENGIPYIYPFTGANRSKRVGEDVLFGGTVGIVQGPGYHNTDNYNDLITEYLNPQGVSNGGGRVPWLQISRQLAYVLSLYACNIPDTSSVTVNVEHLVDENLETGYELNGSV